MNKRNVIFAVLMIVVFASCKKDTTDPKPAEINTKDFLVNGDPSGGNYNFFSFANSAEINEADSSSSKWDFAIRFETFIVNSNASGPGNAGVQIINQPFDAITTAPANSYRYDTTVSQKAIKGADWYTYNPTTRSFSPIAGKTFVFRTAIGKYAKLEMISADPADDLGNLVIPPTRPTKIKYKIRVAYQGDGSLAF